MTPDAFAATPEAQRQPWLVAYYRAGWNASWQGLPRECLWPGSTRAARFWLAGWDAAGSYSITSPSAVSPSRYDPSPRAS